MDALEYQRFQTEDYATYAAWFNDPELNRRQGIASAVLERTLAVHHARGIVKHVAYVAADNVAGRHSATRVGFRAVTVEVDEHG
jgi:L-amino acid N-acyltransferase YncA